MRALKKLPPFTVIIPASIVVGLLAGVVLGDRVNSLAEAATASNLKLLGIVEDRFWNYDFDSQTVSSTKVDWAMSMLFWNNAEVDKVKDIYRSDYPFGGGAKYAYLNDGSGYVWDSDGGKKDIYCPSYQAEARHMRLYADSDDHLYNVSWGYYVLGSTHKDWQECWPFPSHFGWSEETEGMFVNYALNRGYSGSHDWGNFYNYEAPRWEGNHYWDNNGFASQINVP